MCGTCGCGDSELVPVHVHENLLSVNQRDAAHNREHFVESGVFVVNLMGSPGAGKTALLEAFAQRLGGEKLRAVSGDLATDNDGERLRAAGMSAKTITTGQACHLDAKMVHASLHELEWKDAEYLFIENVGNLVCPAIYDLGQTVNIVLLSVTEGEDKPLKYPVMFRVADLVILSKADLLPHLPQISQERIERNLAKVNPNPKLIAVSATTGQGIDALLSWLDTRRQTAFSEGKIATERDHHHHHHGEDHHHHHHRHEGGHDHHHHDVEHTHQQGDGTHHSSHHHDHLHEHRHSESHHPHSHSK
jgi:hydrogenase nickel incorporation protein HypB